MSKKYYVDIDQDLADRLQQGPCEEAIVEALENLVEDHEAENSADTSIAEYDSLKQLRNDESVSKEQRKRNEIVWQRKVGGKTRHRTQ